MRCWCFGCVCSSGCLAYALGYRASTPYRPCCSDVIHGVVKLPTFVPASELVRSPLRGRQVLREGRCRRTKSITLGCLRICDTDYCADGGRALHVQRSADTTKVPPDRKRYKPPSTISAYSANAGTLAPPHRPTRCTFQREHVHHTT